MTEDKTNVEDTLFDDENVSEEIPQDAEFDESQDEEDTEWAPTVSSDSPQELAKKAEERKKKYGERIPKDGEIVTIEAVRFTRPREVDRDGNPIKPKTTQTSDKPFYPGKLAIKFKEDNLIEYYPTMRYFVNDGVMSKHAKLNRTGKSQIKQIVDMCIKKIGKPSEEVSDAEILAFLVGKRVKLKIEEGDYKDNHWFRNNIVEILD